MNIVWITMQKSHAATVTFFPSNYFFIISENKIKKKIFFLVKYAPKFSEIRFSRISEILW